MKLSIIVPILNEETFMPMYLKSATAYAHEILIADGGSTDRSMEWIRRFQQHYNIKVFSLPQTGLPYQDWDQPKVRNFLLEQATGDWVMNLDADEVFDDRICEALPEMMERTDVDVFEFPFVNFWKDPYTVRVNTAGDERWSNNIIRMWRHHIGIRYEDKKRHCFMELNGRRIFYLPRAHVDIPLYHYHYAIGPRIKFNDNRRGDVNRYDNTGEPDWNFRTQQYEIRTEPFQSKHPAVIEQYLSGQEIHPIDSN
ncbi:glycosyltransferase family 2 protein [Paenibacillus konkukensis]|uniref:glycosyltransferase family 2 protein n=1 Tax=Paenibacillus konkukensis TaxID=2020716 RepID=UPI00201E46FF|nr:glycosyltransferase [Paenibacillus konkukensis]